MVVSTHLDYWLSTICYRLLAIDYWLFIRVSHGVAFHHLRLTMTIQLPIIKKAEPEIKPTACDNGQGEKGKKTWQG